MFSVRGRGVARLAATILVSGLVATGAIATAGPALADDNAPGAGGVMAKFGGMTEDAGAVVITEKNGTKWPVNGGLFKMEVDGGGSLFTYCIDLRTPAKRDFDYKEVGWDESSLHNNGNAGKILWILEHAYPKLSAETLGGNVGVDLSKQEAAAGTQAAIWTLSDDVVATPKDEDAEKLKEYLLEKAVELDEPTASLSLSPATVAGKAGEKLGPITVTTNATAKLAAAPGAPAGVQVVGKDGKPVTEAKNGDQIYFDVPAGTADGTAELTAEATTKVSLGRAFVSVDGPSQTLILAGSSDSTVTAKASATWAKKGAVPSVTVAKDCAKGGLEIIAGNKGDEAWTFDLKGASYTVGAGETKTITVPLAEDEAYKFTITGPNGFEETFEGVLDCKTATPGPKPSETPSTTPSATPSTPSTTGGTTGDTTGTTGTTTGGGDLAETGSSSATPMIAGVAAALVVIGGGAVFFLRKKKAAGQ
ncbi:LAETG motif-containing sortase-dependent surface protein [Streptomyces globisporus]|uniref:LAETG motif-containing sortase-dependent surface protein n=1 Tax=Streptomyces globisporus TaxID=1908 RepID=UPI0004C93685|nr:LAETG motif-containing sortase-dependent surface protein [Streptomyces globisporus]